MDSPLPAADAPLFYSERVSRLLVVGLGIHGHSVNVADAPLFGRQNLCSWEILGFKLKFVELCILHVLIIPRVV